jgi:hypothetical protein
MKKNKAWRYLLASLLIGQSAYAGVEPWKCIRKMLDGHIRPTMKVLHNGSNPWIPVSPKVSRERFAKDLVIPGHLSLEHQTETELFFFNEKDEVYIVFVHDGNGGITFVDAYDDRTRDWLASFLDRKGLLELYFESRYIKTKEIPEEQE